MEAFSGVLSARLSRVLIGSKVVFVPRIDDWTGAT